MRRISTPTSTGVVVHSGSDSSSLGIELGGNSQESEPIRLPPLSSAPAGSPDSTRMKLSCTASSGSTSSGRRAAWRGSKRSGSVIVPIGAISSPASRVAHAS